MDFYGRFEEIKQLPMNKDDPDVIRNYYVELSHRSTFILYGAGAALPRLFKHYSDLGMRIGGIADTYQRGRVFDYDILKPEELADEKFRDAYVLITSETYEENIKELLISLGFSENHIFPFIGVESRRNLNEPIECFERNYIEGYKWAYDFFEDSVSKNIVLDFIKMFWRAESFHKTTDKTQYFDEFPLSEYECFVQAGCFDGDTVKEFLSRHTTRHDIYTFEADPKVYDIAKNNLKGYKNISLIPKGLWNSKNNVLTFKNIDISGKTSFIMGGGVPAASVPVVSLDEFFKDRVHKPTFIQLDIEGAEREALKGAEKIIRKYKPKLAICVYHLPDDIYVIPQLLQSFCPDYKMHMQQYNNEYSETVLYATV